MNRTYNLRVWTRYLESPERVWQSKTDPDRLAAEFEPLGAMTVSDKHRADMEACFRQVGNRVQLELCVGPLGFRWPMELELIEPGLAYSDTSENRLYSEWHHEHRIHPASDGCLYVDEVRFVPALPGCRRWARMTERLFQHRHRRTARWMKVELGCVGVSALRVI